MKLPNRFKNLKFRKGSEKGSVTLFVLIAMLFFLAIGMMIFIINMNAETSQKRDVQKIQSEYSGNNQDTDLEQKYQEAKQRQLGKFLLRLIDKDGNIYKSGEWINDSWEADENNKLLKVEQNYPEGINDISVTITDNTTGQTLDITNKNILEIFGFTTSNEGKYTIKNNLDETNKIDVNIDLTKPTVSDIAGGEVWIVPEGTNTDLGITITATDSNGIRASGMENGKIRYVVSSTVPDANTQWTTANGASTTVKVDSSLGEGDYYIYAIATDLAGNDSEMKTSGKIQVRTANYKITTGTGTPTYSDTLADAITKAKAASTDTESTIQVLRAVNDNSEATIDKNITLDTNGKTATMANTITVASGKTATFVDTAATKGKLKRVVADGTVGDLITNNGTVKVGTNTTNGAILESKDRVINGGNSGNIEVISCEIKCLGKSNRDANAAIWGKNIKVNGGTISNIGYYGIVSANAEITGGNITADYALIPQNGSLSISGNAKITGRTYAIRHEGNGHQNTQITISGGEIKSENDSAFSLWASGANVTITGGTITGATDGVSMTGAGSTLTIGDSSNALDRTTPVITGTNGYSVNMTGATSTFNYYDGKLVGGTKALASEGKRTFFGREGTFNLANDTTANFYTETEGNATRRYLPYTRENDQTHKFETVLEKEVKVTFNKNADDATCTETERKVLTNAEYKELSGTAQNDASVTYKNLPRQTGLENETDSKIDRTGYTFKGWNGKNLFELKENADWKFGETTYNVNTSENSIRINNGNYFTFVQYYLPVLKANTTYTISGNVELINRSSISLRILKERAKANGNTFLLNETINNGYFSISFTIGNSNETTAALGLFGNMGDVSGESGAIYSNIQIEEGTTATAYEPYYVTDDTLVTQDTDHTLTAIWEANPYTVHFDGDGATGGTMADQTFKYDEEKALTQNAFTRAHTVTYDGNEGTSAKASDTATYTFANWGNKDILGYDLDMSVGNIRQDNIIGNENGYTTLTNTTEYNTQKDFAKWAIQPTFNPGDKYKVTFYAKGTRGTIALADLGIFFYGETGYLKCVSSECSDGTSRTSSDGYIGLRLSNEWTKYTITWTLGSEGNPNVNKYLMFRVYSEANASIYGVRFEKLENEEHADKAVVKNLTAEPNGEVTLYAVWTPHEVTLPTATREGYIFNGWYDAKTGGNKIGNAGDKYIPEANTELHAQWRQVHYTVSVGEETLPAETLAEAVDIAEKRITGSVTTATITALMDYADSSYTTSASEGVLISKNITIDTKGHEITMANRITVAVNATATFVDTATTKGKIENTTKILIINNGTVKVGTLNSTNGAILESKDCVVYSPNADVEVNSGKLNVTGAGEWTTNYTAIWAKNITIRGGEVINDYKHYGIIGLNKIDITGGKVKGNNWGIHNGNSSGTLNISGSAEIKGGHYGIEGYSSGGQINISGEPTITGGTSGIYSYSGSNTINITGGTITGGANGIQTRAESSGHNITISGGTITGTSGNGIDIESSNSTVSVTGGTITGGTHGIYNAANGTINVSGATTSITGTSGHGIRGCTGNVTVSDGTINGSENGISVITENNTSGSALITGGHIISNKYGLFGNGSTTITMGNNDGSVSKTLPEIISNSTNNDEYGVYVTANATFNFYDGKIEAKDKYTITKDVSAKPDGYQVVKRTDNGRETAVLEKEITVTFEPNPGNTTGATVNPTSKTVLTNTAYGTLPTPTKTGYTFKEWQPADNLISTNPNDWVQGGVLDITGENNDGMATRIRTDYIKVSPNTKYKLNVNNSNGIVIRYVWFYDNENAFISKTDDGAVKITEFTTPNNCYYIKTVLQYGNQTTHISPSNVTDANINLTATVTDSTLVTQENNHTLNAIWEANPYTVHFDGDGATGGTMADQTFKYDEEKALTQNAFTRTHTVTYDGNEGTSAKASDTATYTFANWGNKDIFGYDIDMSDGNTYGGNTTFGNYNGYKTVSLDNTNGSSYLNILQRKVDRQFKTGDKYKLTFYAKGSGTLTTYFHGGDYSKVAVQNGKSSQETEKVSSDGNMPLTLTNEWTKYSVIYTMASTTDETISKYVLFRVFAGNSASIYGVRFEKQENDEHADKAVVKNLTAEPNGEVTLYAVWTPHEVTLPTATREGYIFNGWYTETTGGTKIGNAGDKYIPEANTELHAQWRQVHYTVSVGEETLPAETLAEAVGLAEERITGAVTTATITPTMSYTDNSSVTISKNITLNIPSGMTITIGKTIKVANTSTMTFTGTGTLARGTIASGEYGDLLSNSGKVVVDGATLTGKDYVVNGGNVEVKSGNINMTGAGTRTTNYAAIYASNVLVSGGTITSSAHYAILGYPSSTINIQGGTINGAGWAICLQSNSTVDVSGGTLTAGTAGIETWGWDNVTINITGGTITGGTVGIDMRSASGTLTIGNNANALDRTTPVITGTSGYSVSISVAGATFNYYDGKLIGASHDKTYDGRDVTFSVADGTTVNPLTGYKPYTRQNTTTNKYETVLEKEITVTANANGGTLGTTTGWTNKSENKEATKTVLTNTAYGTLPTEENEGISRTGYTFKGWNGKNLFNEENVYEDYYIKRSDGTLYSYYSQGWPWSCSDFIEIEGGKTYTFNPNSAAGNDNTAHALYDENKNFISSVPTGLQTIVTPANAKYIRVSYRRSDSSNIQLEEGSTATSYEPYYITAETPVTTAGNHDITAVWEAIPYTLTADANGGTITSADGWSIASGSGSATKTVYYEDFYGSLPTAERSGYAFLGWYKENTFVNRVDSNTQVQTATDQTIYAKWLRFALNKDTIYLGPGASTTISPEGTTGAIITYTGENIGELQFESENTSVATVGETTGTIVTSVGATDGATTNIIIKDKTSGIKIGELTVVIDITPPEWLTDIIRITRRD